jgi:glycine/D-amino acid oxidase-like deaminating enzyme
MRKKGSQNQGEEPERMSRLAVIGAGYVGLVTSATLAHLGHDVCCADIVPEKVAMLSRGEIPIVEPGRDQMVRDELANGRLRFVLGAPTADLAEGLCRTGDWLARELGHPSRNSRIPATSKRSQTTKGAAWISH